MSKINEITIISPTRMMYISKIFKQNFERRGIKCHVVPNEGFDLMEYNTYLLKNKHHYYFIYCLFLLTNISKLIPNRYIIYQLEQHTNDEISHHYRKILSMLPIIYSRAYKVFDYNQQNIDVLEKKIKFRPFLLPIPFSIEKNYFQLYDTTKKEYDIIFIGLINDRRKKILLYLQKYFKIGIPQRTIYGNQLVQFVSKGKMLLNIHYYSNAILERPRLNEMIPIGIPIVSEKPNPKDLEIVSSYEKNIHFIDIIDENNIQSSLVSDISNHLPKRNVENMQHLEKTFHEHVDLYF